MKPILFSGSALAGIGAAWALAGAVAGHGAPTNWPALATGVASNLVIALEPVITPVWKVHCAAR